MILTTVKFYNALVFLYKYNKTVLLKFKKYQKASNLKRWKTFHFYKFYTLILTFQ